MKQRINILCTLGPSSLNKSFLEFTNRNVDLLRLNMSHVKLKNLETTINYIRKYSNVPICIDTEGAQIRTKVTFKKRVLSNRLITLNKSKGNFKLYPENVFGLLKLGDLIDIGFEGLEVKVKKIMKSKIILICTKTGILETNKGVHIKNRKIPLNYLTDKDHESINIGKKLNIKNYALSFTNTKKDIIKFNNLLKKTKKIYKIETALALKNFKTLEKYGNYFLIDRGDLSKSINTEMIPYAQRYLFKKRKKNTKIAVATNFLESMIENPYPTRAEANDIYNSLEMGSNGLVLAAETAIGKYPIKCVEFLKKMIRTYKSKHKLNFNFNF